MWPTEKTIAESIAISLLLYNYAKKLMNIKDLMSQTPQRVSMNTLCHNDAKMDFDYEIN